MTNSQFKIRPRFQFLSQLAAYYAVNVENAHGINAKADVIAQANHLLSKHKFMVKYLLTKKVLWYNHTRVLYPFGARLVY